MSSRSILFFFKKPVNTVNNDADVVNIPESSCPVVNSDLNSEKVSPFQIVFHYQKSLIIHRKVLCFQKLTLDLEILVLASIAALITEKDCEVQVLVLAAFGLNTERYSVSLCIQSKCEKMREKCGPE